VYHGHDMLHRGVRQYHMCTNVIFICETDMNNLCRGLHMVVLMCWHDPREFGNIER
jgi:hypothetical protein